ncbi:putative geranyltranstransferase [Catonella morbi ATCC 51271]|uniref:Farnesyl diphosphate synthase n=1 Tax=Catonella morbi ATCC 51271 TaxID=592026 RepID=V2Z9T1_9FIRM|nr:farnesyl diphosphate synthase [Catonella morbi]ESL03675.1 putative geranyltranstransferase [Catonella morbi ATCC 51271]
MNNTFTDRLRLKTDEAEKLVAEYAPKLGEEDKLLEEAMNYSLLAGGKRLRPLIMLEIFRLFGGKKEGLVRPFAAALEMIHTYSLIHDDLPAMDNDDLRRGRPTNHKVYGEAVAILAGDGLLNLAAETSSKAFRYCETICEYKRVGEALSRLFTYSGADGMIGGQILDMLSEEGKKEKTEDFFLTMYDLKTGGLIKAAFVIGALLAGAGEDEIDIIEKVGASVGLVFQLQDDILDISGDETKLGKPVRSDERNNKLTYLKLLGADRAKKLINEKNAYIIENLKNICNNNNNYDGFISEFVEYLKNRDR